MISLFMLGPLFLHDSKGLGGWEIGIVVSLLGFAPIVVSFPAGVINDRFSIHGVINLALVTLAMSFFCLDFLDRFYLLSAAFLVIGIAGSILDTSIVSLYFKDDSSVNLSSLSSELSDGQVDAFSEDANKKYGNYSLWVALGASFGVLLGGFVTFFLGFRYLFILYAVIFLLLVTVVKKLKHAAFNVVPISIYKQNIVNRKTALFLLLAFTMTMHWGAEGTVYARFLKERFGFNNLQVSLYISLSLFALAVAAVYVKKIAYNKKVNRNLLLAGFFMSAVGQVFMVNQTVLYSFSFRVIHEFGDGLINAIILIVVAHLFEKKSIGGSSGLFIAVMTVGSMAGAMLFSPMGERYGFGAALKVSGVLLFFDMIFCYIIFRRETY